MIHKQILCEIWRLDNRKSGKVVSQDILVCNKIHGDVSQDTIVYNKIYGDNDHFCLKW